MARRKTLRIATFNVNGIRAAERRGFGRWLAATAPDVVGLQEVRCAPAQVPAEVMAGYHLTYHPGELAGRNGVALMTRVPPSATPTLPRRSCTFRARPPRSSLPLWFRRSAT